MGLLQIAVDQAGGRGTAPEAVAWLIIGPLVAALVALAIITYVGPRRKPQT